MCDSNNCPSGDAPCAEASGTASETDSWRDIEGRFRLWSFRVYYNKSFATEPDPTLRFAKALIASCQPIRDRRLVYEWHRKQLERHRRRSRGRPRRKQEQDAYAEALST